MTIDDSLAVEAMRFKLVAWSSAAAKMSLEERQKAITDLVSAVYWIAKAPIAEEIPDEWLRGLFESGLNTAKEVIEARFNHAPKASP